MDESAFPTSENGHSWPGVGSWPKVDIGSRHAEVCPQVLHLRTLAATIKARLVCEQAHQLLKEEIGLDPFAKVGAGRGFTVTP
jgi:hypothetical protein